MPNVESYDDLVLHIAFARLKGNNFSLGTQILDKVGDERRFFGMSEAELQKTMNARSLILDDGYRRALLERALRQARHADKINVDFNITQTVDFLAVWPIVPMHLWAYL